MSTPSVMTIAGSDPSGGAGLQADLKTFTVLRVYGTAIVTALTVQNTIGVREVVAIDARTVSAQIDAVAADIPPGAVKTGMLATRENVEAVASAIRKYGFGNVVIDPVMHSSGGAQLLAGDARELFCRRLIPLATVLTPNLDEAEALLGIPVRSVSQMRDAAERLHAWGPRYVFIKGGHLDGDAVDVLFDGRDWLELAAPRVEQRHTHGTGCVLSAAAAALLARGENATDALTRAKALTREAIQRGLDIGQGRGPCDPVGVAR